MTKKKQKKDLTQMKENFLQLFMTRKHWIDLHLGFRNSIQNYPKLDPFEISNESTDIKNREQLYTYQT